MALGIRMKQRNFYAMPADLSPVFQQVELKRPVAYTLVGLFDSPSPSTVLSGSSIPTLGDEASQSSALSATYLITAQGTPIHVRSVQQKAGGTKYAVDQLINPNSITITHGGLYSPTVLIAGRVATASNSAFAVSLQSAFSRAIAKSYTRIQSYWVGPDALAHMQRGGRLTFSVSAPPEYDLAQ